MFSWIIGLFKGITAAATATAGMLAALTLVATQWGKLQNALA